MPVFVTGLPVHVLIVHVIVVLDGGKVREFGSHQELMARGGMYAELYELQSRGYR
ncbi:hypothetical protein ACFQ1S_03150 [Kibdelosporangium lantanae]|uniref:ABC transporter ATP-binding protein n=1 Tax=Kibdelosporangium lantanae TaxID=1497396 RepID=A0ABW3M442_9PSEU